MAPDRNPGGPPVTKSADNARQAVTGHRVWVVLLLGILGLLAAYLIFLPPQ